MSERYVTDGRMLTPYENELLTHLIEECGEVIHACTKIQLFGVHQYPGQRRRNDRHMSFELGNMEAVIVRLKNETNLISADEMSAGLRAKLRRLNIFQQTYKPQPSIKELIEIIENLRSGKDTVKAI